MNLFKIPLVKVIGLLALAMLLAAGCTETPQEPNANTEPNTFITSYNIVISPDIAIDTTWWSGGVPSDTMVTSPDSTIVDTAYTYATTVYWRSSDPDGEALRFHYWLDDDAGTQIIPPPADGDHVTTFETQVTMPLDFSTGTEMYTFYVETEDNRGAIDSLSPASIDIAITTVRSLDEFAPNTEAITVPPNGASTSRGVPFVIGGKDVDGVVTKLEWAVDDVSADSMWTSTTPDVITTSSSSATITLTPSELSFGPHTIYFRAVDNTGNVDPSPLAVSIICDPGYAPEVAISVLEGFNFVVPFTAPIIESLDIDITVTLDFYYGELVDLDIITSEGDTVNTTDLTFTMTDLASGSHWIKVTAHDVGGNSTADSTNFGVVELPAGDGVLCVNGIDWASYGEAVPVWEGGAYWGNRTHFKIWDLFSGSPAGGDYADSLLGTGTPPLWIIDTTYFDAIVWAYNNYTGDNTYWEDEDMQAAIVAYLESGGNLWIGGRLGSLIFTDGSQEFYDYCQYSSAVEQFTPGYLVAVNPDFTDITIRTSSSSLTDAVMVDHDSTTQIYEADNGTPGMGWIITPNGAAGGGAVAYIGGRHYRFNIAELKSNMDVILADYFGIVN